MSMADDLIDYHLSKPLPYAGYVNPRHYKETQMPDILFPPGRMVGGNLGKLFPRTESNGTPKLGKDGQPEMQCSFGFAIPKAGEQHWAHTAWGKIIYETGAAEHPNLVQSPAFSWKVTDGDSQLPNKKGKRPCDQVGYPGHWVLWFSQGWLPKRVNSDGTVELQDGAIVAGYYIQVYGSVAGNKMVPNGTPGVYLNPIAVALVGHGERISTDVDTTAVGFGAAPLPQGAQPVAPVVPGMPAMGAPAIPPLPGAPVYPPVAPAQLPIAPPVAPVGAPPVAPHAAILTPPAAPVPPAPVAPVAPTEPVMLAKAGGVPYASFVAQGWTDQQLREQGYMQ